MGVFNNIYVERTCPACRRVTRIECQAHVASSAGGNETGRFCLRDYELGQRMAWYAPGDAGFHKWRLEGEPNQPEGQATEACYSSCTACKAELCVVIRFEDITPVEVLECVLEENWPEGYFR